MKLRERQGHLISSGGEDVDEVQAVKVPLAIGKLEFGNNVPTRLPGSDIIAFHIGSVT